MATLHERAVALSESWGCSYKEALAAEQQIDQIMKPGATVKTKVKEAPAPVDFYTWLAPNGSHPSALKEAQPQPDNFFTWLTSP